MKCMLAAAAPLAAHVPHSAAGCSLGVAPDGLGGTTSGRVEVWARAEEAQVEAMMV